MFILSLIAPVLISPYDRVSGAKSSHVYDTDFGWNQDDIEQFINELGSITDVKDAIRVYVRGAHAPSPYGITP